MARTAPPIAIQYCCVSKQCYVGIFNTCADAVVLNEHGGQINTVAALKVVSGGKNPGNIGGS